MTLLAALPLAPVLLMALPPQSNEELQSEADRVVIAEVTSVLQREVDVPNGKDVHYTAEVKPLKDAGGRLPGSSELEKTLTVKFRQTGTRPPGWAGPQGQNSVLKANSKVKLYLRRDKDGGWWLLEPNGWSAADEK